MSATPIVPMSLVTQARARPSLLLPAPRFPILLLPALPAAVLALSSEGRAQQVSALIAIGWFSLVPIALFERWVALALPVVAAAFLTLALAALPSGSAAQTVDFWTSATLFVLALLASPRPQIRPYRRDEARQLLDWLGELSSQNSSGGVAAATKGGEERARHVSKSGQPSGSRPLLDRDANPPDRGRVDRIDPVDSGPR